LTEIMRVRIYADLMGIPSRVRPKDFKHMWEQSKSLVPGDINSLENAFPILKDSEEHKLLEWVNRTNALVMNCSIRLGERRVFPLVPREIRMKDDHFSIYQMNFLTV